MLSYLHNLLCEFLPPYINPTESAVHFFYNSLSNNLWVEIDLVLFLYKGSLALDNPQRMICLKNKERKPNLL